MNFSTNQVMQMFVLDGTTRIADPVDIMDLDKTTVKGVMFKIKDGSDNILDSTDIIDVRNILSVTEALATDAGEQLRRKGLLIKLSEDALDPADNNPISGQDYVITLTYRGNVGEEDTYSKVAEARACAKDTPATLLQKLATSFLVNQGVEYSSLYELHLPDEAGTLITKDNVEDITDAGFYVVEPVPYWSLGRFEESLMKIEVRTAPILLNGEEVTTWLENYKFEPVTMTSVPAIMNSHKVADLEYFCKGERGTSNAKLGWPDTPDYTPNVNPNLAGGYDILTIHYAFVGANASNQKSEKDMIFVAPSGSGALDAVKEAL